jgi:hypothetical protein
MIDYEEENGAFTLRMASAIADPSEYFSVHSIDVYEGVWPDDVDFGEYKANAHLIAAAPDMLAALNHAENELIRLKASIAQLAPIRAAISKAGAAISKTEDFMEHARRTR